MSVTAVPLHPIKKGSLTKFWAAMVLVVILAVGLAVVGTRKQQVTTTASGLVYRVIQEGTGEPATAADLAMLHLEIRKVDGTLVGSTAETGQPQAAGVDAPFPGLRDLFTQMREGGVYEARINTQAAVGGAPIPPGGPVSGTDNLIFQIRVMTIGRGEAARRAMGGGGPGGPGGPPGAGGGGQQMTPEQMQELQRMLEESGAGGNPHAGPGGPGGPPPGAAPSGPPAGSGAAPPRGGQSTPAPGNSAGGR